MSTAITSPLGGTIFLVNRDVPDSLRKDWETVPRDISHFSSAFRLTLFCIKVLSSTLFRVSQLATEEKDTLFYYLPLAVQLIEDDLSIENCSGIIGTEQHDEYAEDVIEGRKIINRWANSSDLTDTGVGTTTVSSALCSVWQKKLGQLKDVLAADYRVGQAFVKIVSEASSLGGKYTHDDMSKICRDARTANAIQSAAWIAVLRQSIISSAAGTRLCNELVADGTGLKAEDGQKDGQSNEAWSTERSF